MSFEKGDKVQTRSDTVSATMAMADVTTEDIDKIVEWALKAAMTVFKDEFKTLLKEKICELSNRVIAVEATVVTIGSKTTFLQSRLDDLCANFLNSDAMASVSSATTDKLRKEIEAVRRDSRDSMLAANDIEKYNRRNNIQMHGLMLRKDDVCRESVVEFLENTLNIHDITTADIEAAHPLPSKKDPSRFDDEKVRTLSVFWLCTCCHGYHDDLMIGNHGHNRASPQRSLASVLMIPGTCQNEARSRMKLIPERGTENIQGRSLCWFLPLFNSRVDRDGSACWS